MTVKLIDIHHAKDVRDLALTYNAGYRGLINKISEGTWFVDPSAIDRCQTAHDIGFVLGGYHFFRSNYSGNEQAHYFLKAIEPLRKMTNDRIMPPWLDLETIDGICDKVRMREALQWMRIVSAEFKLAGMYSSPGFWTSHTTKPTWIKLYWQWLAQWTGAQKYSLPAGWSEARARVWQYGIAGRYAWCPASVPGIRGQVDVDKFMGTLEQLRAWCGYDTTPTPSPPAPLPIPPNHTLEMLDLMLKANIDLNKAIKLARQDIEIKQND